ncbi:MAG: xanthine dehydrogenase family protein subunit M [Spiribacter salinus]|uniref:Xanthine dehydrogenase family protein subunit M n=1 Tax=Spiribacter salinus TaxID=1335746 RepID=A0A540VP35_9GAMM|nr:MAG: xanthine dehydrogenase family protein subunit M [Spiribacter salinus]
MKASAGGYARATDLSHALALLAASDGQGRVIAGGQSLVAAMNMRLSTGDLLVDISRLSDLRGVQDVGDAIRIGALTRHVDIGSDPLIKTHAPLLAKAVGYIAHAAIRNRGTIGGACAHADPAAEFPACVLVLDAVMHVTGPDGDRSVPADEFFLETFETAIAEGEILTSISVPKAQPGETQILEEVARRSGDYALAGLCLVQSAGSHRVSLFSVAPKPILARRTMEALDAGGVDTAVMRLAEELDPPSDTQASATYRQHLAGVLLRRAVARIGEAKS